MCGVGDENGRASVVADAVEVGTGDEDSGQLTVGASGGLQRDGIKAGDLGQVALEAIHQFQRALHSARVL